MNNIIDNLIWALVLLSLGMTCIFLIARPLRRALNAVATERVRSAVERDLAVQTGLVELAERRNDLAIQSATLTEEQERRAVQLRTEIAAYETDIKAASETLPEAIAARKVVLAARAEAEAAAAPELLGHTTSNGEALARMYEVYCKYMREGGYSPCTFENWKGDAEI
jgi:hypothetical protein